jgi:hypothetical protein
MTASNHKTARIPVADVDHGKDTASATARPSASRDNLLRSYAMTCKRLLTHILARIIECRDQNRMREFLLTFVHINERQPR